ncbi:MAG: hypothetical protein DRQ51_05480, partial [Gammaproteobacteria bacterium]
VIARNEAISLGERQQTKRLPHFAKLVRSDENPRHCEERSNLSGGTTTNQETATFRQARSQ